ncbi:phosphatase PAP2 family protein [Persicobacter sp. CCB-QB2]|uniref:phosphatase PAP2 family protein n=1 Tax=Persicobacter sp. CCB-QB2 TaxID=1561025 RepID=UPI0006A9FF87|nr:phosphatase PAP2 family protein [Persicobacter sp. CCB-QB2]
MVEQIFAFDREVFLWFNGWHADFMDPLMAIITNRFTWIPLYLLLVFLVFKKYRQDSWIWVIVIGLTILLADQIASGLLKPWVARLRPSHEPLLEGLVHIVGGRGGTYGFVSSHSSNSFAIALIVWKMLGKLYPCTKWMFLWAALVAYSRIYVGVHYPLDIIGGALVGLFAAWISFEIGVLLSKKFGKLQYDGGQL